MSEIITVNAEGRRLYRVAQPGGGDVVVARAASEQEVRDWLTDQLGAGTATALTVTDAGHADRTEVAHWGLTDRI